MLNIISCKIVCSHNEVLYLSPQSDFWVDLFIMFKFDVRSPGCLA